MWRRENGQWKNVHFHRSKLVRALRLRYVNRHGGSKVHA